MLFHVAFIAFLLALFTGAATLSSHDEYPKGVILPDVLHAIDTREVYNNTFDLGWQARGLPLFSGWGILSISSTRHWDNILINIFLRSWDAEASVGIADVSGDISLSLECQDCRTWGSVDIEFEDGFDHLTRPYLSANMTFNNVGAYFDFAAEIDAGISTSIGLGTFFLDKSFNVRIFHL